MTLSLRGRLLIGVISLVVVGLVVADVATYLLLQKSLNDRVDTQLGAVSTRTTAEAVLASSDCIVRRDQGPGPSTDYPDGTFTALLAPNHSQQSWCILG